MGYMFRPLNSHLQAYSLQVKSQDSVHTLGSQCVYISEILKPDHSLQVKSQDSVHTLGSQCVYISEILKPDHLPRKNDLA